MKGINQIERQNEDAAAFTQYFAGTDFDGNAVTAEDLKGHDLTVVNVWATNCGPCVQEMPELNALSLEMINVQFIGLCIGSLSGDEGEDIKQEAFDILDKTGVTYKCMFPDDTFRTTFLIKNISTYPTTYLLNGQGEVIERSSGAKSKDEWRDYLNQRLEEQKRDDL